MSQSHGLKTNHLNFEVTTLSESIFKYIQFKAQCLRNRAKDEEMWERFCAENGKRPLKEEAGRCYKTKQTETKCRTARPAQMVLSSVPNNQTLKNRPQYHWNQLHHKIMKPLTTLDQIEAVVKDNLKKEEICNKNAEARKKYRPTLLRNQLRKIQSIEIAKNGTQGGNSTDRKAKHSERSHEPKKNDFSPCGNAKESSIVTFQCVTADLPNKAPSIQTKRLLKQDQVMLYERLSDDVINKHITSVMDEIGGIANNLSDLCYKEEFEFI